MLDFYNLNDNPSIYENNGKVKHVKTSIKAFCTEKDQECQMKSYLNMLSVIEGFIVEEQNKETVFYVVDRLIGTKIYDYIPKISNSFVAVIQTLRILPQLESISKKTPPPIILNLFSSSCLFSSKQKQLIQLSKNYFTRVFSLKDFSFQFESNDLIDKLWPSLCQPLSDEIQNYIIQTIRLFKSKTIQIDINAFRSFTDLVEKGSIPPENSYFASKYIITLFSQFSITIPSITTNFINCEVPKSLEILLKSLDTNQINEIFKGLLKIDTIFFQWMGQICSQNTELQDIVFKLVIEYIFTSKTPTTVHTINQYFPLKHWFTDFRRPLSELASTIQLISEHDSKEVKPLIPYLFKIIDTDYSKFFNLIKKMTDDKKIFSYSELAGYGYLQSFVIKPPPSTLKALFTAANFEDFTKEVFKKSTSENQSQAFKSMFNSDVKIESLSHFLNEVPSVENIKSILIEEEDEEKLDKSCQIIFSSFEDNAQACNNFIAAGGLQWLERTNDSYFVLLLSCLVKRRSYEELDNYINTLPKDHKIFSLPLSEIEKIVYGMNKMKFRPIRVVSLFHLLKPPETIDPYNAYILGKSDYPSNGYDCPLINQIGNRYIKPQYISMLLARPYEIRRFCDNNFDHFPLFQFFIGIEPLKIQKDFYGISFWVKFHQTSNASFFNTNYFKLLFVGNSIVIKTDNNKTYSFKADSEKWIHICTYIEHTFFADKIILMINGRSIELTKTSSPIFKLASIENSGNGMVFLGSAIRLYSNFIESSFVMKLMRKGPSFISLVNKDNELMITPYQELYLRNNKSITFPPNCFPVPYFGFPFHFISQKRLSDLFNFLDNSRTEEQFDSIFHTLICINEITIRNTPIFWQRMVRSIKNASLIKKDYIHEAVKSVSNLKNDEWTLSSILFDNELWKCVDNETLVDILFDEIFKNIDFSHIQGFELFMTTVILQNPGSNKIIEIILKNGSHLQNLVKWIISFLGIANCIDGIEGINDRNLMELITARGETKVQHTIIDSLKSFIKQDNVKEFIKNGLSFDTLCGYIAVSVKPLASHFLELITHIEKVSPGYIEVNDAFIIAVAPLASFQTTWMQILELQKMNSKFNPLLLSLVWATTLSVLNALSVSEKFSFKVFDYYERGVLICIDLIPSLFQSKKCLAILNYWFPLIFNYPIIYHSMSNKQSSSSSSESFPISKSKLSNVSLDDICAYDFMIELISSVLSSFGFETPKNNLVIKVNPAVDWLLSSSFLSLLMNILITCNYNNFLTLFPSLIFSFPFFSSTRGKLFIPSLFENFLMKIEKGFPYMKTVLDYSIFSIAEKLFFNNESHLLDKLFVAMKKTNSKEKLSDEFIVLFIGLFDTCSRTAHQQLSQVLVNNLLEFKSIVVNSNSQLSIFYVIYLMSKVGVFDYNLFIKSISAQFNSPKDRSILELIENNTITSHHQQLIEMKESHRCKLDGFYKIHKIILNEINKTKFINEMTDLSNLIKNYQNNSNRQSCDIALDYKKNMKVLASSFLLIEERLQWERFMTSIHDLAISESSFAPKCFHLSPRCLQFMAPQVLTPSPYPPFLDKKKKSDFLNAPIVSSSSAVTFLPPKIIESNSACDDHNSNFFNYFESSSSTPDTSRMPKSYDDDIDGFRHEEITTGSDKNCTKMLYDQTFTNEPKIYVDQRKVSTYTPEIGLPSSSSAEVIDFLSIERNNIEKESKKRKNKEINNIEKECNVDDGSNSEKLNVDEGSNSEKLNVDEGSNSEKLNVDEGSNSDKLNVDEVESNLELKSTLMLKKRENQLVDKRRCVRFNSASVSMCEIDANPYEDMNNVGLSVLADNSDMNSSLMSEIDTSNSQNSLLTSSDSVINSNADASKSKKSSNLPLKAAASTASSCQSSSLMSDVIWQYRHHIKDLPSQLKPSNTNFLKLFESVFGSNYSFFSECRIERHITQIPSIVFVYDDCLLILTHSAMKNNDINLLKIEDDKKLHVFLESVFLGHWGETKLFASHIVLYIPMSSIIRIKQRNSACNNGSSRQVTIVDSYEFWSFKNGNFIIKINQSRDSKTFYEKVNERVDSGLPKELLLLPNNSPEALVLSLNDKYGRSFVDMSSYPFFPGLNKKSSEREKESCTQFPNCSITEEMLSSVLPFAYSSHHYCNEAKYESIPANFYFTSEFFMNGPLFTGKKLYNKQQQQQQQQSVNNSSNLKVYNDFSSCNDFKNYKKFKNLSRKRSALDSQRITKTKLSYDFSLALQKLLKLREGLRDRKFLNEWIIHHFPDETSNANTASIGIANSSSLNNVVSTTSASSSYYFNRSLSSSLSDFSSSNESASDIVDMNSNQFCQKLNVKVGNENNIQFTQDGLKKMHLHSVSISINWSVHIEHENLLLAFCSTTKSGYRKEKNDNYFAFASSINVSRNGLFLSVDFVFGLTRIWRIKYKDIYPSEIEQISDFSWSSKPTSLISGTHFICATRLETEVVIWEINGGTIHRILKFGTLITAMAMDDEFGAIWITTVNHGYYYSINGQRLAEIDFEKFDIKVTAMTAMPSNYADRDRTVICGCDDGKVLIATSRIETRTIDVKILPSKHSWKINRITFHPNRTSFLTTDISGAVFIWSAGEKSVLPLKCFEECAICKGKPDKFCDCCGRAICYNCAGSKHKCIICHAHNLFVNL